MKGKKKVEKRKREFTFCVWENYVQNEREKKITKSQ